MHHVWDRGNGRRLLFHDAADYSSFLRRLAELKSEARFELFAYCLMPNHFHLLIRIADVTLSSIMHRLLTSYARRFNDRWQQVGHPFQDRFKNRLALNDADIMGLARYVHLNPVAAGLCPSAEGWPWSGHAALMGQEDSLVDSSSILDIFGGRESYFDFLRQPLQRDLEPLEVLAEQFGGLEALALRSRNTADAAKRLEFARHALAQGYQQKQIAALLQRTEAAVSQMLRGT